MESPLLIFAILVATMTYQAAFNPPGGVWQDDYPPSGPEKSADNLRQYHKAGEAILSYEKPLYYYMFQLL